MLTFREVLDLKSGLKLTGLLDSGVFHEGFICTTGLPLVPLLCFQSYSVRLCGLVRL